MKQFKIIDFWINVGLIIGSIIYTVNEGGESFFVGYFVVGGWQVISMLTHFFNKWLCEAGTKRKNYHLYVLVIFITAFVGLAIDSLIVLLMYLLLFTAPIMAVFYTWLCFHEIYVKMRRPLALLK